jgi:hypothetical protein
MIAGMDGIDRLPGAKGGERREERRVPVSGVALLQGGGQAPAVWRLTNLSQGGAALIGDGTLPSAQFALGLHVAGFAAVDLEAKVLRRQLVVRDGKCAVRFVGVGEAQKQALRDILAADHSAAIGGRRALIVDRDDVKTPGLSSELVALGFNVRRESAPEKAAAWLQREETEVVLVGERIVAGHRWNLLEFIRDTAPEIRRFVLASDVRGFRLYYAIKAGLVEGLIPPDLAGEALARYLLGAVAPPTGRSRRAAR